MKWIVTTKPAVEPILYGEAKAQARMGDDERVWVENIAIPNARDTAETEAQLSLITRTITLTLFDIDDMHLNMTRLPRGPVQAITSVTDGNSATISPSLYQIRRHGLNDFIHFEQSYKFPITIVYTAGFGNTPTDIPASIRGMMLAHVAWLYDNRTADADPTALDRIYRKYRSFCQ